MLKRKLQIILLFLYTLFTDFSDLDKIRESQYKKGMKEYKTTVEINGNLSTQDIKTFLKQEIADGLNYLYGYIYRKQQNSNKPQFYINISKIEKFYLNSRFHLKQQVILQILKTLKLEGYEPKPKKMFK